MATIIDLEELTIGVLVNDTQTTYFKDLTEATKYATEKLNNGCKIEMLYCDKYGCRITK